MRRFVNFVSRKQNWLGLFIVLVFIAIAIAAPRLSPQTPSDLGYFKRVGHFADLEPHPPSSQARLGTLTGQFDVFHTLVWGTRNALQFGLLVALLAAFVGIIFGAVSGYAGGFVNSVMMRISDAFLAFPVIAGVVFLQQLILVAVESAATFPSLQIPSVSIPAVGAENESPLLLSLLSRIDPLMISLIVFSWMPYARLVNSMVLGLKNREFVQAARALGASPARIVLRHLIPNSISPAIVLAARDVGSVVLLQATLTFIQIGGNSPWGELLARGRNFIIGPGGDLLTYWWVYIPATLTVILFGISWNLLGDGINDVLNPEFFVHGARSSRMSWKKNNEHSAIKFQAIGFAPDPVLATARDAIGHKDVHGAMHAYTHLIERDRDVNAVIRDLAEIAKKNPKDAQVWRTLGDALARNGEPEDARRAYAQADKNTH